MLNSQNTNDLEETKKALKHKIFIAIICLCTPLFIVAQAFVDGILAIFIWLGTVVFLSVIADIGINMRHGMAEARRDSRSK
ncbi:MAG: hypothetical protein O7G85_06080 [Planctomycetota bacterium]|nr:hypothetical protein [Planctomycetota bacterium]